MKHLLKSKLKLCFVTNIKNTYLDDNYATLIKQAVRGGVTMVQLREKGDDINEVLHKAIALKRILKPMGVPLIINDFVELANYIDADGVHIGPQDMDASKARKILGPNKIIGLSIEGMDQLYNANNTDGISYVTASAVFPSKTKPNCKKIWGLEGLEAIARHSKYPVTTIGGITPDNIYYICNIKNVYGVAVIGYIERSTSPYDAARKLSLSFELGRGR